MAASCAKPDNLYRNKMTLILPRFLLLFFITFSLASCGIEEYYFLPQVPEGIRSQNIGALINIPSLDPGLYYYASGYTIFYRIYLSSFLTDADISALTHETRREINPALARHYNELMAFTDPTNATLITTLGTFTSRNFFELDLDGVDIRNLLTTNGGSLSIQFNDFGDHPVVLSINGGTKYPLLRSNGGRGFMLVPDRHFIKTPELNNIDQNTNIDVDREGQANDAPLAYVLMYIVAVGRNPETHSNIYSKPTFINIFALPS
jgi:hypothetical protein